MLSPQRGEGKPDLPDEAFEKLRQKAFLAPSQLVLIFTPRPIKIPVWEQQVTASCAGYAVTLAAHALGLGAIWKSSPFLDGARIREVLGEAGRADAGLDQPWHPQPSTRGAQARGQGARRPARGRGPTGCDPCSRPTKAQKGRVVTPAVGSSTCCVPGRSASLRY